jgi:hypothetical protein
MTFPGIENTYLRVEANGDIKCRGCEELLDNYLTRGWDHIGISLDGIHFPAKQ